ncbi:putative xanthine dehydrogenase subunit A [Dulcicalothrix desertica PCC 7102]|uniref:Putative xanthine dehydrogenase subunit A n=1 Tax=Dulcicalothrix desertica PCC 7102 TaxID=232991 RepID=A0A3S1AR84_9CYAN|nr:XdhC/CoxI family protein [Dulcicalothrix desertica]RUT07344.1 putative xanthine dehydrogenase subunit A [Dulcicalothrix desertica PCC 7102]TWH55460.1 xanthine/CO dehydrogenase XdhC/CoxF family maturation factor [Dulcicalothrix desertica PCC 7102]
MNELQAILEAFDESQKSGETAFLATVVKTQGSTYRRAGAKMLITSTGKMVGTISGGCLENDVFEHTRQSMSNSKAIVVTYDNTAPEDIIWGFGLGCNGVVQVLIESLDTNNTINGLSFIKECLNNNHFGIIATVFHIEGEVNIKTGARLFVYDNGSTNTDIQDINLTKSLITDAQTSLINQKCKVNKYQLGEGSVEVFIEVIQPPTHLVIFGAGRDAVPVAEYAKTLGWHVTIVDCRASNATYERFPMADEIILARRETIHQVCITERTATVVMTHNYLDDIEIVKMLLLSSNRYIGVLGSRQRIERLLTDLRSVEAIYTNDMLEKLHAPIGIDIGAETPEQIAMAIIAEVQAVLSNRNAGFLKNRTSPIHSLPIEASIAAQNLVLLS